MSASECLKIAGEAAEVLEEMGFTAVARLREGIVTLECWERGPGPIRMVRQVVDDVRLSKTTLARTCANALRSRSGSQSLS
jgi:hypothetical protein